MSVPLQALRAFPYASRRLKPGDQFEARGESDARLLCAIGHATRHVQVPQAITDPVPDPAPVAPKRGKGYRKQSLETQASTGSDLDSSRQGASEAQASEDGIAEKPGAGNPEAAPAEDAPSTTRRRYQRRDLQGAPE